MKVELKGIEIAMGEKSVRLTIAEVQELRKQLNELFNEKITYVPSAPVIIEREVWPWWKRYDDPYDPMRMRITCTTNKTYSQGIEVYCCTK